MNYPEKRFGMGVSVRITPEAHAWLKERSESTGLSMAHLTTRLMRNGMRAEGVSEEKLKELRMMD